MHVHWMKYSWQIGFREHRAGRSSEPLHKSSLKFLSLWLWHYRETENEWDGQREKSIMISEQRGRKSLTSCTGISLQRIVQFAEKSKQNHMRWAHLVILFTNVTVCLNAILYDIIVTTCLCVQSSVYQWKLQISAIQADRFKYVLKDI